jgi:hypothetical protein
VVSRRGAADQAERLLRSARVRHLQSPGHFGEMQRRLVVPAGATEPTVLQSQRRNTRASTGRSGAPPLCFPARTRWNAGCPRVHAIGVSAVTPAFHAGGPAPPPFTSSARSTLISVGAGLGCRCQAAGGYITECSGGVRRTTKDLTGPHVPHRYP